MAKDGDTILLAGKGHEHNIFIASGSVWWDEAEVARQELAAAGYRPVPAGRRPLRTGEQQAGEG